MSNKRLRKLSGAVLGGLLIGGGMTGFGASKADASLTLSLQFANGASAYTLTSADVGKTVTVQAWATVTGSPTAGGDYGMGFAFFNIQSNVVNGGVVAGSLLGRTLPTLLFDNGGLRGTLQDLNGDGIGDIGSTADSPNNLTTGTNEFIKPNAYKYTDQDTGDQSNAPVNWDVQGAGVSVTNGYSWKLYTTTFKVNSLNASVQAGAALQFNIGAPAISNGSPSAAQWFENGTDLAFQDGSTSNGAKYGAYAIGSGVSFVVNAPIASSSVSLAAGNDSGKPTISVTGSGGKYNSNVLSVGASSGSVNIVSSPGDMSEGHVYVAAWLTEQSGGQIAALISELQGQGVSILTSGTTFDKIAAMFPGDPNLNSIFDFGALGGNKLFSWNFAGADAGVQVSKLAAVPEPASIGLLGLGAVGLLARRRRRA